MKAIWLSNRASAKLGVVAVSTLPLLVASVPLRPALPVIVGSDTPDHAAQAAKGEPFAIRAAIDRAVVPGGEVPLNLMFANPNTFAITVTELAVDIREVHPLTGADCGPENFDVRQFSGAYGFAVPGAGTADLRSLGYPVRELPHLLMINLATNQDGCKGASVALALRGSGREAAS